MNAAADADDQATRALVRALRTLPDGEPPADFADRFAGQVARAAGDRRKWAEGWLLLAPGIAFIPAAWYAAALDGDAWRAAAASLSSLLPGASTANWWLAGAACLALSWVFAQLRPSAR